MPDQPSSSARRDPFELREHLRALGLRDTLADDIVATWPHEGRILAEIEAGGRDVVARLNRADAGARSAMAMTDDELLRWYHCERKCRHPDERAARTAAHIIGPHAGHWRCTYCDGWHVGTTPTRHVRPGKILKRARAKAQSHHG